MQDINLLQNKLKDRTESSDRRNMALMTILVIILIAVIGGGVFFSFMTNSVKAETDDLKTQNAAIKTKLESNQGQLADAKNFQAQLKNIDRLLDNHVYWSEVFDELQTSILKQSQYMSITAKTDGTIHVQGQTDNYQNLGKLILSLSTNSNFRDVKLISVQTSSGQTAGYTFALDFKINEALFTK